MNSALRPAEFSGEALLHSTLAPRVARVVVTTVFLGIFLVGFLHVMMMPVGTSGIILSLAYMITLLLMQLCFFGRPLRQRSRTRVALALVLQACLVYLPIIQFGQAWVGMPGFLAGSVLLVLPLWAGAGLFAAIAGSMGYAQVHFGGTWVDVAYTTTSTVITGLVVAGLSRLAEMVREVADARTELAERAVDEERLRFARDLHDLLGYSLSAITLKAELTHRLVTRQPARARQELEEVLDISRTALVDVRAVASGYRTLSLEEERQSVRSVLAAAGVRVAMSGEHGVLPCAVETAFATVMREAVTNVLRHSRAEQCEIRFGRARGVAYLEIVNDGVTAPGAEPEADSGSGLANLASRLDRLGGELVTTDLPERRFRLAARVPVNESDSGTAGQAEAGVA